MYQLYKRKNKKIVFCIKLAINYISLKIVRMWRRTYACFLKVHKHEIFFLTFFAETETLWSQGPVTRDF